LFEPAVGLGEQFGGLIAQAPKASLHFKAAFNSKFLK
jgi:hypothetical protein